MEEHMKRFVFVFVALLLIIAPVMTGVNGTAAQAAGAPRIKSVDAQAMVGMTAKALAKKYGNPVRREPSEYGFTWYVYNRDYKNYFLAGVSAGKVVAAYATAKTLCYGKLFKANSTKAAVRKQMGKPLSYVRAGNSIFILPNANQRDVFEAGDNFVYVFYDIYNKSKVTSVMVVPKAQETELLTQCNELSSGLTAAYQRISVDLVNAARAKNGLRTLKTDKMNTKLAVSRSTDMRDRDYFSHYTPENKSPFDIAKKMGIRYRSMGENIAYGNRNAMLAHESFMNSKGHRSNILKKTYTKIGAGAVYGGTRYVLLTNIFSR